MKLETILDAMVKAYSELLGYKNHGWTIDYDKRNRQYHAFRDRILRMDAEKDKRIAELEKLLRKFEWYDYDDKHGDWFCVICDANKKDGHADDCRLAKELADE